MQQPAFRLVNAARKRGVHAEGFSTYLAVSMTVPTNMRVKERHITYRWASEIRLALPIHHEHIRGLHQLLLYTAGRDEDVLVAADADATARTGDPAMCVELSAEGADVVCGMQWVVGVNERF